MTNAQYILTELLSDDRNLANILIPYSTKERDDLKWEVFFAAQRHFEKKFANKGNCKNKDGSNPPCYWTNMHAFNEDKTLDTNYGRTEEVMMQVWLTLQYDSEDWSEEK